MEWVKSLTGYYRLLEIATGTDAMEVMFKRADALAGEIGSDGFIPDAMLPQLTRKPGQAKKTAQQLVDTGLWVRVAGGYLIVDWVSINAELKRLQDQKKRDRDRKRASRATSRAESRDVSADSPADGHGDSLYESERKTQKKTAAAAAGPAQPLPPALEILKTKLDAARLVVRWDRLTAEHIADIQALIAIHGDGPLVKSALMTHRPDSPAAFAQAWIGAWSSLPEPGAGLRVVSDPCTQPGHSGTTDHCTQCASERLERGAAR
jgi:hypothetical protein